MSWWLKRHAGRLFSLLLFVGALAVVVFMAFPSRPSDQVLALGNPSAPRATALPQPTAVLPSGFAHDQQNVAGVDAAVTVAAQPQIGLPTIEQEAFSAYNCAQKRRGMPAFSLDPALSTLAAKVASGATSVESLPDTVLLRDRLSYDPEEQNGACNVGGNNIAVYPIAPGAIKLGIAATWSEPYNLYAVVILGSE